MATWLDILSQATTADIPKPKEVVEVMSTEKPSEGFQKLIDNHILSAPVFDVEAKKYVGFLDMRDFVSFVVFYYNSETSDHISFVNIMREGLKQFQKPTDGITSTYLARRHLFRSVSEGASLKEVATILSDVRIHRVPIVNSEGRVVQVISQSAINNYLNAHLSKIDAALRSKTIRELNIGTSPVDSVPKETKAIDVFRLMEKHNRSGLAVVDNEGHIVGATSGRDLKGFLRSPNHAWLELPIFEFLKLIRQESVDIAAPTISVKLDGEISLVVGKMAATRVHRIFAVTSSDIYKPERVISITDLLKIFTSA